MSTPTLYDINVTLMNLIFDREDIASDLMLNDVERQSALNRIDLDIREHLSALVKKVDGVAYILREFKAHAATAKAEKERARDREYAFEARYERLEALVKSVMLMSGKARLDGDVNTLRLVKCPPSVEIAQPELLPNELQDVTIVMPLDEWDCLIKVLSENGMEAQLLRHFQRKTEPRKSKIAEALKQTDPCQMCDGIGRGVNTEAEIVDCDVCGGTGKVSKGVPGCRLVTDKMSLRVE